MQWQKLEKPLHSVTISVFKGDRGSCGPTASYATGQKIAKKHWPFENAVSGVYIEGRGATVPRRTFLSENLSLSDNLREDTLLYFVC